MYIFSVFKNIFKASNIGTIIFFLLNAAMIIGIFSAGGQEAMITIAVLSDIYCYRSVSNW